LRGVSPRYSLVTSLPYTCAGKDERTQVRGRVPEPQPTPGLHARQPPHSGRRERLLQGCFPLLIAPNACIDQLSWQPTSPPHCRRCLICVL
jgi:hypothetical protein